VIAGAALIARAQPGGRALRSARTGWLALALTAGAALPVQGAINAQLRTDLDAPIAAASVSFVVATTGMAVLLAASLTLAEAPPPRLGPLRELPWWGWLGGLCGAVYVTSVFLLIPKIGAASTIALTVAGQQAASVFVDGFGLLRLPRRAVSALRLGAVGLLLIGVVLVDLA
jgi:bacterial/archaeal transporter family-2 protein